MIGKGAELVTVSCDFDEAAPAATAAQAAGKIVFTLCAQSPKFGAQGIGPFAYSPNVATLTEGYTMAEWGHSKGWKTAFELVDKNFAYTEETCSSFDERWEELGGEIVGTELVNTEEPSIASQISQIKAQSPAPEVIRLCGAMPTAGSFVRQIRAAGLEQPILATYNMDGSYWLKAVPDLSEFYYPAVASIYGDDPDPTTTKFVKNFEKRYGAPPATSYALDGAAILEAYKTAVERAGTTEPQAVADELNKFEEVPLIVGDATYTDQVHILLDHNMDIIQIQNGKDSFLEEWKLQRVPTLGFE